MRFSTPLVPARLVRRYKRFLADVTLDSGETLTAHCPNPGAMLGLDAPGTRVWLEPTPGPRRKLSHAWRLSDLPGGHRAGIDTTLPNRIVKEALAAGTLPQLAPFDSVRPEVRYGENSRIDFLLSGPAGPLHLEVKSVTLRREGDWAEFPDCVTARGTRHLVELARLAQAGQRAALLFVVQRSDCTRLRLAADIDPAYARAFDAARAAGVAIYCHATHLTPEAVTLGPPLPIDPSPQSP